MSIIDVITPPDPVVTYDEAKAHLRLDSDDEKAIVENLIATATAALDGPDGWLGRALGVQTLELKLGGFPPEGISLPLPPVVIVESIAYDAPDRSEVTLASDLYRQIGGTAAPRIVLNGNAKWPATACQPEAVRVRYQAGYPDGIPKPIRQAILLGVGALFETREDHDAPSAVLTAAGALLAPFKVY